MVWVFEYGKRAGGGFERVGEHALTSGSRAALVGLVVAPLGLWLGRLTMRRAELRPRRILGAAATACLALWLLGPFVG